MGSRESSSVTAACPVVSLLSQDDAWLQIHGPSKSKIQTRLSGRAPSDCSKGGRSFLHTGRCIRWAEREDQCIRCISRRLSASLWCWQTTRRYAIFTLFCPPKRGTRAFAWPYRIALENSAPARSWSSFAGARGGTCWLVHVPSFGLTTHGAGHAELAALLGHLSLQRTSHSGVARFQAQRHVVSGVAGPLRSPLRRSWQINGSFRRLPAQKPLHLSKPSRL